MSRIGAAQAWSLSLAALCLTACGSPRAASPSDVFDRAADLTAQEFFDPELNGVDWAAARARHGLALKAEATNSELSTSINGLLAELDTSHTHYYHADEAAFHFLVNLFGLASDFPGLYPDGQASYVGAGWFVERIGGQSFVSGVLGGGPAEEAGVLTGDLLLDVNGAPWTDLSVFEGRAGQPLSLRVQRGSATADVVTLHLVPRRLQPLKLFAEAVSHSFVIEERRGLSVAVARMWSYAGEELHELLVDALTTGPLKDAHALVLDLRGGWGGASPAYLDLFHAAVPALTMTPRDGDAVLLDDRWRRPVVLLIDEGTRSGKELLAHGFQEHGLGPLVGKRTAGAVVGGRPFAVSPRGLLYLAVVDVTVDGLRLEGVGVEPDVVVDRQLPFSAGADPQLERALDLAAALLSWSPSPAGW